MTEKENPDEAEKKTKKGAWRSRYDPYGRGKETLPFFVKVKPRSVMGDYIALHGLVPENELPVHLRHKIPENEIWIRKDVYENPKRRERILQGHEKFEIGLMETRGLSYKQAHRRAELHEKLFTIIEEIRQEERNLGVIPYDSVNVIEEPQKSPSAKKKTTKKQRK
ncbi:MAG TPA: hypothetical protein DSN98_03700 [Thermoplasmata archaeon]|jgi:hypothetical protein|nr:MAG TPA: hypothetical protein DSN98_03700 [Thermoplasmata archaeon]